MTRELSSPEIQTFHTRIAEHVRAIQAAAREYIATREAAGVSIPGGMNVVVKTGLTQTEAEARTYEDCAPGMLPFFEIYECGHFLDGTPYYCQNLFCK